MLPRALPFRIKFNPYPRTKKSAAYQPDHFKWRFVRKERPLLSQRGQFRDEIPAVKRWFLPRVGQGGEKDGRGIGDLDLAGKTARDLEEMVKVKECNRVKEVDKSAFEGFDDVVVPLEKVTKEEGKVVGFERFEAPLFVFLEWNKRKIEDPNYSPGISLYLAQYSLADLPKPLQADLVLPHMVKEGGDSVYGSSLWMGVPPTDTPLHRDPNPNFFVQLAGRKRIRLLKPQDGDLAYTTVRTICAEEEGTPHFNGKFEGGNFVGFGAKVRGNEMMAGLEKKVMDSLIWGDENGLWIDGDNHGAVEAEKQVDEDINSDNDGTEQAENEGKEEEDDEDTGIPLFKGLEATLGPGDGCFIPTGWWHSLRGIEEEIPGINASVNWWFRPKRGARGHQNNG